MGNTKADSVESMKQALYALWDEAGSGEYDNPTRDMIMGAASRLEDVIAVITFEEGE